MRMNYCVNRAAEGHTEQLAASPGGSAGLPQARPAPWGGSAVHAGTSVGDE